MMATSLAVDQPLEAPQPDSSFIEQDPFLSPSTSSSHHRFSNFDTQLFSLGPSPSPDQARGALEAHLAETDRRIREASKLGITLVQQRKDLAERLKDVEKQQSESDVTPELRQKLVDIEKEYNEVGRESARAFLPKSRVSSSEMASSPFSDTKRSISPSKFESQGSSSPSKLSVPTSRRQRNQPSNRAHDIEFVTEISTSLLSQVRHLQALLLEKEEALKAVNLEKTTLEVEAEGLTERLRSLDESEHRYKDENWNLETQIHEFLATAKEAADRERKLTQSVNLSQAEKIAAQKELDEIKSSHAKLSEDHAAAAKHYEVELGSVKRNMILAETDKGALQRKIEDLTGQNQELARAVAHQRGKLEDQEQKRSLSDEDFETANDDITPEHSPPPSPIKGTPRHSLLESETLKSSLHHAHRMIQNLKGNIHREKTEKLELKRMLQDARDELDARRVDFGSGNGKRTRKVESKEFKKPLKPGQLGGLRNSKSEVFIEEADWEEDHGQGSPSHAATTAARIAMGTDAKDGAKSNAISSSDQFETANEQESSDAFETANERATETEGFHTGHEELSGSDELTETEEASSNGRPTRLVPKALVLSGKRQSFHSTASTSDDEYNYEELKTPTAHSQSHRLRLKVGRGSNRGSRALHEDSRFQSSPASFATSSRDGTPQPAGQSLFAELGDLGGSDEEDSIQDTPNRSSRYTSQAATPASRPATAKSTPRPSPTLLPVFKTAMVDSGMMTDPWRHESPSSVPAIPHLAETGLTGSNLTEVPHLVHTENHATGTDVNTETTDPSSQRHVEPTNDKLAVLASEINRPISTSTYSDMSSQYEPDIMEEKLARFPSPPTSRAHTPMTSLDGFRVLNAPLSMSMIVAEQIEPIEPLIGVPSKAYASVDAPASGLAAPISNTLELSSIQSVNTAPIEPLVPSRETAMLSQDEPDREIVTNKDDPETPKATFLGSVFGWNNSKQVGPPFIAEDETRQSPGHSPPSNTSELQRPFKELAYNSLDRAPQKPAVATSDESAQTLLTGVSIDELMRASKKEAILAEDSQKHGLSSSYVAVPVVIKGRRSQDSIGSVTRARSSMANPDYANDTIVHKRSGSVSSRNNSLTGTHPPLPNDHKQVIAAAAQRSGSSSGGPGSMGPPSLPASAYRANPSFRPRTPSTQAAMSPGSVRGGTTPRPLHSSGTAEVQTPSRRGRSRASSVSSFASEVETRFNRNGVVMPQALQSNTDPRMINAITQTMIGEYLWKYTRKAGRGAMSENRHRRYFWVHPYTRTLYWSDRDPSSAGRAELKAKSVPIEAVRVVTDDNPMPPGLHRKSLVIITPGRAVKFTATTGQRHETWFNALSYLLLRTGEDAVEDTSEVANGSLTHEDVAEFNPGFGNGARQGPASLSSYNSRTTRNISPAKPRQHQDTSMSSRTAVGTFSRLSSYWKPGKDTVAGSFSSRRSRHSVSNGGSIYEASEVHDSAEDLREIIQKQDRESDRLENVRACCDGKHDVGHLHTHSSRSRHSHTGPSIGPGPVSGSSSQARTRNKHGA